MLTFENLSGRREVKESNEPFVIATPTKGEFKIMPKVAEKLGITDGTFVTLVKNGNDVYIGLGKQATPVLDENGNPTFDERGRQIYEENTGYGSVARASIAGGSTLKVSGAAAWEAAGGDENKNRMYTLAEGVEGVVDTPIKGYKHEGTFFKLVFEKEEDKIVRGGGDDAEEGTPTASKASQEEVDEEL
jgi:hypothetical protein